MSDMLVHEQCPRTVTQNFCNGQKTGWGQRLVATRGEHIGPISLHNATTSGRKFPRKFPESYIDSGSQFPAEFPELWIRAKMERSTRAWSSAS